VDQRARKHRLSRARAVKSQFLSDIIIYRMGDNLRTFQLQYEPTDLTDSATEARPSAGAEG
jgi:hypothetical protein